MTFSLSPIRLILIMICVYLFLLCTHTDVGHLTLQAVCRHLYFYFLLAWLFAGWYSAVPDHGRPQGSIWLLWPLQSRLWLNIQGCPGSGASHWWGEEDSRHSRPWGARVWLCLALLHSYSVLVKRYFTA